MMSVSLWLLWDVGLSMGPDDNCDHLFFLQLALNSAWWPVFFGLHPARVALVIIVLLAAAIGVTNLTAWRTQRIVASLNAGHPSAQYFIARRLGGS
jgi:benzodiazapine receptor